MALKVNREFCSTLSSLYPDLKLEIKNGVFKVGDKFLVVKRAGTTKSFHLADNISNWQKFKALFFGSGDCSARSVRKLYQEKKASSTGFQLIITGVKYQTVAETKKEPLPTRRNLSDSIYYKAAYDTKELKEAIKQGARVIFANRDRLVFFLSDALPGADKEYLKIAINMRLKSKLSVDETITIDQTFLNELTDEIIPHEPPLYDKTVKLHAEDGEHKTFKFNNREELLTDFSKMLPGVNKDVLRRYISQLLSSDEFGKLSETAEGIRISREFTNLLMLVLRRELTRVS